MRTTEFDSLDSNESQLLTPQGNAYASELSLARIDDSTSAVVWIDRESDVETVCWRMIQNDGVGPVRRRATAGGAPGQPTICGPLLIWNEFADGRGTLFYSIHEDPGREALPVKIRRGGNYGDFSCSQQPNGRIWLVVELWESDCVNIWQAYYESGKWHLDGRLDAGDVFRARPRIFASDQAIICSHDAVLRDQYVVISSISESEDESEDQVLNYQDGQWDTLSSVCLDRQGTYFAARSRDRLIHLHDGIAGYHSELVVSSRRPGLRCEWQDIASVNIDHGMNPWMAPYCGRRRQPYLVPRDNGVWLLWEEKEDVKEMNPPWGRLCAMQIDASGAVSDPLLALDKVSMVVVEQDAEGDSLLVATRTRDGAWQNRIPYHLQHIRLDQLDQARPRELESNSSCDTFELREPPQRRPEMKSENLKLYFGDPHIHSWWSQDLDGEQDELYHLGRDVSKLDFMAFTENDFHWYAAETYSDAVWQRNRRNAEYFNEPGEFTALLGWEFTKCGNPNLGDNHTSHRCVLYPGAGGKIDCWYESDTPIPAALAEKLSGERVLLHHHHPGPFDLSDDSVERNIEVCSGWWNCMEKPEFVTQLHELLGRGFRTGFFGGSDNHVRTPGIGGALTGVWATENTREGIFDAFWNRRIFATTGLRPDLRFMVSGAFMGSETTVTEPPLIHVSVQCESPVAEVEILRDGQIVHTANGEGDSLELNWSDPDCSIGDHYYYAHVLFDGQESNPYWNIASAYGINAWTSPVWIHRK